MNGDKLKQVVLDKRPRYLIVSVALSDLATCKIIKEIKLKLGDSIHIIAVIGSELMISSCEESGADKIIDRQEKFGEIVNYIKGVEQSVESGNPVGKAVDLQPKQQVKTREKYLFRVLVDKIKTDD